MNKFQEQNLLTASKIGGDIVDFPPSPRKSFKTAEFDNVIPCAKKFDLRRHRIDYVESINKTIYYIHKILKTSHFCVVAIFLYLDQKFFFSSAQVAIWKYNIYVLICS